MTKVSISSKGYHFKNNTTYVSSIHMQPLLPQTNVSIRTQGNIVITVNKIKLSNLIMCVIHMSIYIKSNCKSSNFCQPSSLYNQERNPDCTYINENTQKDIDLK